MQILEWDDRFLLGLVDIDQHHRYLIGLMAKIHNEFIQGMPDLEQTLCELESYAQYHFKSEELWMVQGFYPQIAAHKKAHQFFIDRLSEFKNNNTETSQYRTLKAILFLEEWITDHILGMDAGLGAYLSQGWSQLKVGLK